VETASFVVTLFLNFANSFKLLFWATIMTDDDSFDLYDLKVEWVAGDKPCWCNARPGDHFTLKGEHIEMAPGTRWSLYTMSAILPLLPAKQRETHENDWMTTDAEIACPDPGCGSRFRVTRTGKTTFHHSETTAVELKKKAT
jgi:uncharacterized repeat protein (TIGR04076 family)